jgi:hypothetical protein
MCKEEMLQMPHIGCAAKEWNMDDAQQPVLAPKRESRLGRRDSERGAINHAWMPKAGRHDRRMAIAILLCIQTEHAITPWVGIRFEPQLLASRTISLHHLRNVLLGFRSAFGRRHASAQQANQNQGNIPTHNRPRLSQLLCSC